MKVVYAPGGLPPRKRSVVVAGVFDGVHRGHAALLRKAVRAAKRLGAASVALTFQPHPAEVLHRREFQGYISSLDDKIALIAKEGIDVCVVLPFTPAFARMTPEIFVRMVLVQGLKTSRVIVGEDFHFGHDREGSIRFLKRMGAVCGFSVDAECLLKYKNKLIKSKYIREFIIRGDLDAASRFLGRPYSISGKVVHGDGRGRKLGFPTANMRQENVIIPPSGIYLARVEVCKKKYNALFYIGRRPSFKKKESPVSLEAYLIDCSRSLYGSRMCVQIIRKVRDEMKFSDEESLVLQMKKDLVFAARYFSSHPSKA